MLRVIIQLFILSIAMTSLMLASADSKKVFVLNIKYETAKNAKDKAIQKTLKKEAVSELVAEVLQDVLKDSIYSKPLNLSYGGEDGPLYDDDSETVFIPYSFIEEIKKRFIKAKYSETGITLDDAVMDVVTHTILHEVAHALISQYEIPVVVKEEDAADSLAAMMLVEYFEDGQEIALTAADLFDLESEDVEEFEDEDFWDEHSLDVQRYYSTICYIYGSDPKEYADLKKDAGFSEDRAELCIDEYEQLYFSWKSLLNPSKKKKKDNK